MSIVFPNEYLYQSRLKLEDVVRHEHLCHSRWRLGCGHPCIVKAQTHSPYVYRLCVTRCITCTKQGGREQFVIGFPINHVMSTEHTHPYLDSSENKNTKSSDGNFHPDSSENQNTKSSDGEFHDYSDIFLSIKESAPNIYIKISIQVKTKIQNRVTGIFMSIQVKTKIQNRVTGFLPN